MSFLSHCLSMANKKSTIYTIYWLTVLSACTMGETAGDYFSFGLAWGYAVTSIILGSLLLVALLIEVRAKTQSEFRYWSTIVIMSTTGTAFADLITRTLALGYGLGSLLLMGLFGLIYLARHISIRRDHSNERANDRYALTKNTIEAMPKTDVFYWLTILIASTFGTTMGDFVSDVLGLGFGGAALLLGSLFMIVVLITVRYKTISTPLYWIALVIASTIGAATGDYLTKPDGLALGYAVGSVILISIFAIIFFVRHRVASSSE